MSLSRRLLFASAFWEVARPRTALTAGHLLIRLSNPAIAFDFRSAADWLACHHAAREALAEVLGAGRCSVVFAHQWHPIGAAIGEPEVESSTPTFHLFGRWDREPVSPGEQLRLPAQRRVPAPAEDLMTYDAGLRTALRRSALSFSGQVSAPESSTLPEIDSWSPKAAAGPHHTVLAPAGFPGLSQIPRPGLPPEPPSGLALRGPSGAPSALPSGGPDISPGDLLALAAALQGLTARHGVSGLSCVVPDPADGRLEVHALGRAVGEPVNPMERLLDLPEVSHALL